MPDPDPRQSEGRKENAARPVKGAPDAGPDQYPDAKDSRSFEPKVRNETAPRDPTAPAGDPAEGKR